jgi:hypothetical protein
MATGGIVLDQGAGIADLDLVLVQEGKKMKVLNGCIISY